ncbi:MAG: dephospho-CoA kinase [Vibrionaceae bacterium]
MTFTIGLTGGIGSGKSTVSAIFAQLGIEIIDADIIARRLVMPGMPALQAIVNQFGHSILEEDGSLNRAALRSIIFSEPQQKEWLNSLLHPLIHQSIAEEIAAATSPYCLLVAPLLIENGLHHLCQRILVIDVAPKTQIERTALRDKVPAEQVSAIIAAQLSREVRLSYAHDVVKNEDNTVSLYIQIKDLHAKYLTLSKNPHDHNEQRNFL